MLDVDVVIVVDGGVASVWRRRKGLRVLIIDRDNEGPGEPTRYEITDDAGEVECRKQAR